jgi:hypothetical protein
MITSTQIRNALTGALAIMALGVLASCSEGIMAPADDMTCSEGIMAPADDMSGPIGTTAAQEKSGLPSCALVDGVWACGGTSSTMTLGNEANGDDDEPHCEIIMGVLHCPPDGEQ